MKYFVGLDVAMKSTSVCIVDSSGNIVYETSVKTDPKALSQSIKKASLPIELIGLESGSISHFLVTELQKLDLPAICMGLSKKSGF